MWEKLTEIQIGGAWATAQIALIALALGLGLYLMSKIEREGK